MKPDDWYVPESAMREIGFEWDCCHSCHDDADHGYAMMPRQLGPDPLEVDSCCTAPDFTNDDIVLGMTVYKHARGIAP